MLVEKRICDVDGKLIIYHENLKRLRKRLEVLKQIHDAPNIYAFLVVEVVRRRKFSSTFTEVGNYLFLSGNITELLNETVIFFEGRYSPYSRNTPFIVWQNFKNDNCFLFLYV